MIVLLAFAFISGLITILAPCIWPLLPIVLSSSTTGGKEKALGISLGIVSSFAFFTLTLSYVVRIIPFDPDVLRTAAVVVIAVLGLTLVVPKLSAVLEGWVSRLSASFGTKFANKKKQGKQGFGTGFITGGALGIVWSPCAGPILATIAALAATRAVNTELVLVTAVYSLGVGIPLFLFALFGNWLFTKSSALSRYTGRIQQVFGIVMIATALLIATNYDKVLQVKLLDTFPSYSNFLFELEGSKSVQEQLNKLKKQEKSEINSDYGQAPEFAGISKWLNSEPLTMSSLQGKVVLIDFWTYTCINCIRTLPHITGWWKKYEDEGLVIVGVHTPEFEFEKKTENVLSAIKQYGITYPVAQDNDFKTWDAYNNRYWPAKYLIDAKGHIRYTHFGEGKYEETEQAIRALLEEAGKSVKEELTEVSDETSRGVRTPETYLGSLRMDRFASKESIKGGVQTFSLPKSLQEHEVAYQGTWNVQDEYAESSKGSALELQFYADKVFLVITPKQKGDRVKVLLDGKVQSTIVLDEARLYEIIDLKGKNGSHRLRLEFQNPGIKIYAFTFG